MRQLIIARKDLQMSPGKLAAQVSHASMAFLSNLIRNSGADRRVSMETGEYNAEKAAEYLSKCGFTDIVIHRDLAGQLRLVESHI